MTDFVRDHLGDDVELEQAFELLLRLREEDEPQQWMFLNRAQGHLRKASEALPNPRCSKRNLDPRLLEDLEKRGLDRRLSSVVGTIAKGAKSDSRHDRRFYLDSAVEMLQRVKDSV